MTFDTVTFRQSLDTLCQAFEAKDNFVSKDLQPAIDEQTLRQECNQWFPAELPQELIALYGWRGGMKEWEDSTFWFRDYIFSDLESAQENYLGMMEVVAEWTETKEGMEFFKNSFPFASFNGAYLYLPCYKQNLVQNLSRPVISVFEGISLFFNSMQSMLDTCIEWVNEPSYKEGSSLNAALEAHIWKKHNPGLFDKDTMDLGHAFWL